MFKAISAGKASVVTDHIDRFVENGILLKSGKTLEGRYYYYRHRPEGADAGQDAGERGWPAVRAKPEHELPRRG